MTGMIVENWKPAQNPDIVELKGQYVRLERLSADRHAAQLYQSYDGHDTVWDYLPYGPFHSAAQYHKWIADMAAKTDPYFFAIKSILDDIYIGVASFLRIDPEMGTIEVGHINFSPRLQKTPAATEAMYLMMKWAFENGYRRYEWKCNSQNTASRRAAQRYGLSYEGTFRQAAIVKGRNRDTAWFAAIDAEWPNLDEAFQAWLHPSNFTADGTQKERLGNLTHLVLVNTDPTLS